MPPRDRYRLAVKFSSMPFHSCDQYIKDFELRRYIVTYARQQLKEDHRTYCDVVSSFEHAIRDEDYLKWG
jgi:hypothetical protein